MSETVTGYIDHIIFRNEENGYTVMVLKETKEEEELTCVGSFPSVTQGASIEASGVYTHHPVYGKQFQISSFVSFKTITVYPFSSFRKIIWSIYPVTVSLILSSLFVPKRGTAPCSTSRFIRQIVPLLPHTFLFRWQLHSWHSVPSVYLLLFSARSESPFREAVPRLR